MSDAELGAHPCDGCGQTDTDPMVHIAYGTWQKDDRTIIREPSFHFDCLPEEFRSQLQGPSHAVTNAAIEAAESGTKGAELREFILTQPNDNEVPSDETVGV